MLSYGQVEYKNQSIEILSIEFLQQHWQKTYI